MFSFPESPAFLSGRVVQDVDDGFDAEAVQKLALEMIDPQTRQQMVCFFFLSIGEIRTILRVAPPFSIYSDSGLGSALAGSGD